jgi:hypothetical protein
MVVAHAKLVDSFAERARDDVACEVSLDGGHVDAGCHSFSHKSTVAALNGPSLPRSGNVVPFVTCEFFSYLRCIQGPRPLTSVSS